MTRNIFEALRESHEQQRALYSALTNTSGDTPERRKLFEQLKTELAAHALAEDRHFYVPLIAHDAGVDLSRHAIAEHHEIDELVEKKFEGSLPAFIAAFTRRQDLSDDELDEVQQMIDRIRKGERS